MFQHSDRVRHAGQSPIGPGNTFKLSREPSAGDPDAAEHESVEEP